MNGKYLTYAVLLTAVISLINWGNFLASSSNHGSGRGSGWSSGSGSGWGGGGGHK